MVFISPKGHGGEIGCLSAICTYTKYVWFRTIRSTHARAVAWALLAVNADAGVFPMRLGNDREKSFRTKVVQELGWPMRLGGTATWSGFTGISTSS